jgi:GNAT superfamily N-acetyltransferase
MIRPATMQDTTRLVEMARRFVAETAYAPLVSVSEPQLTATVDWVLSQGALFVATAGDALVGMIAVLPLFAHPVSGERVASELCWWVEPEHRNGSAAVRLLHAAETWAREQGAVVFQMVAPNQRVEDFYQAMGYDRVEVAYQKRVA